MSLLSQIMSLLNPIALRQAKIAYNGSSSSMGSISAIFNFVSLFIGHYFFRKEFAPQGPHFGRTSMAREEGRKSRKLFPFVVGCFGLSCPLRQYFSLYRPSPKEREKEERKG